jgi:2-hydroxychromene-2-carboxylate isomerase
MPPPATLEFWFDFGSNYSYLSAMRIEQAAQAMGLRVAWRPFLLGPIFKRFGWDTSPFVLQKEKGRYMWRDMERLCAKHGLPWRQPSRFPRAAVVPMRVAVFHEEAPWVPAFCRRCMSLNFAEDRDIDTPEAAVQVLDELGVDGAPLVEAAQSDAGRLKLRQRTEAAQQRGIFGAPTFFVNGEMFWGNDRLEDALDWARHGFARQAPGVAASPCR